MLVVEPYKGRGVTDHTVEVVERKGTGHPDQICDSLMEAISVALCREYQARFGTILHHNIDKGLLAAGRVEKRFGGGRVLQPMELVIGDRATFRAAGQEIPVAEIAVEAARAWLRENLRFVDPERHIRFRAALAPGSAELTDIFSRPGQMRVANDTSAAVGYYPLSPTERAVLAMERHLNGPDFKGRYPQSGEDVKVMGARRGTGLELTVAMPLLAPHVGSEREYFDVKAAILEEMREVAAGFPGFGKVAVQYNTLDLPGRGLGGVYLSLLGTSAEDADSGQVGRGNRINGLIALNRPLGTEAAAGKNPVSHVGKIYNVLSHKLARDIYEGIDGVKEVYVLLLSRIGAPVDQPRLAAAQLLLERGRRIDGISRRVEAIVEAQLAAMGDFCAALARGDYPVC
jgi:S-adenosylmethionine synthetase